VVCGRKDHRETNTRLDPSQSIFLTRRPITSCSLPAEAVGSKVPALRCSALRSPERSPRQILERASNVQYSEGYLLYLRETVLVAQHFDPKTLKFSGDSNARG